ncbi:MAG TPA: hypothetical protein DEP53_00980 [Bacteroidetes bacterium]|nr:hypothetical protein [Bacteroidota bacterium]
MFQTESLWFLPLFLYAETHYRFPYFFSLLRKNEPEIIADAPHRIEPGSPLPILILIKDAHLFPCELEQVRTELSQDGRVVCRDTHLTSPLMLGEKYASFTLPIDVSEYHDWIEIDVAFSVRVRGVLREYHNDNHRFSSRDPLRVFLSSHPLPRFPDLYLGDPHVHSTYTEDQVEFGSPLPESQVLARAMGLSFICVTDHSYDLDDRLDNYLENDANLPKWKLLQTEIDQLNEAHPDCVVIRGEEVTCRNSRGKNVHLLLLGQRDFVRGSGDSAERELQIESEYSIAEVIALRSETGVAYAAHAMEPVPFLQRLLLGRSEWLHEDFGVADLSGLQIVNGKVDEGLSRGLDSWTRHLLQGRRLNGLAGSDAHGNFNRFRQIGIPFLTIRETTHHIFGKMRTGVFVRDAFDETSVLRSLKEGKSILTDGPIARIVLRRDISADGQSQFQRKSCHIGIEVISTPEFGRIDSVRLVIGKIGRTREQIALQYHGVAHYEYRTDITLDALSADYARAEVYTLKAGTFDGNPHFCLTNPLWFEYQSQ